MTIQPASEMKNLFIVDDHPTLREGLCRLIEQVPSHRFCGQAASVAEALEAIPTLSPDLVITDISLPDRNGLELIKDLCPIMPNVKILVFTMHDEMVYAERSIKAGARGYLMKGAKTSTLIDVIDQVMLGRIYLSPRMSKHLLPGLTRTTLPRMKVEGLTDRELEVFELIGLCRSGGQIAEQLRISPRTVDAHRYNIKTKLGLPDGLSVIREAVLWVELNEKFMK